MKRFYAICSLILTFILLAPIPVKAADTDFSGKANTWKVRFTKKNKMVSTFNSSQFDDVIDEMQPGDSVTFTVDLKNQNKETTRWYMSNEVLKSLEEVTKNKKSAASSGAYEYVLTYINSAGTAKEIYNSETVGGEDEDDTIEDSLEGLNEATDNLEDYFYLDTLKKGKGGQVTLKVALDGETQGNAYEDTVAQLALRFAVELNETPTTPTTPTNPTPSNNIVKTGDETQLSPMIIMAGISGLVLLLLAIYGVKVRKDQKKGVQ